MKSYMYMIAIPFALIVMAILAMSFTSVNSKKSVVENKAITQVNH